MYWMQTINDGFWLFVKTLGSEVQITLNGA